ncbi:U32 family peptidase [uncultured Phascolarctobacterium sp.]|uniref:U32 family peptidase n=1 Tax=uncultured Phascolarctobacterium sp. TaxID=512296 RepID=UPI0025DBC704|nr:U32 family peptidase [uncultured Phascolarctobacterium sp.]
MEKKKLELLAPAGSWEALEAAVNAGADAVYMGGKAFGARAYASNFDQEEMARAVYFAHMHRVRLYITVNTLVDDSELEELAAYLLFLNNVGVDGIIVQDMGVIRLARRLVPQLPLHASTQMTLTNSSGVDFAVAAGMERSVLARELSLKEIQAACSRGSEIETFIHGALCVCYSGQCLMSSLIGGRSGNRGRCAQPCRLPYKLLNGKGEDMLAGKDAGQYLLSPKDMNTLAILPQMIEAGVVSYKIEGRMKRPEYVAVVVDAYRRAMDSYLAGDYHVPPEDLANIEQIFNRDFTTAYLTNRPGKEMMSDRRPNNRGVLIGRVAKLDKQRNKASVKLEKELHLGDGLEFWVSVGGRVGTTVTSMLLNGKNVEAAGAGQQVVIDVPNGVRLNDRVFRTLDSRLMAYAQQFFGPDAKRRIPVDAVVTASLGQSMTVTLTDDEGNTGYGETDFIVEAARKRALDDGVVRKQIDRLGTTEYFLNSLRFEHDEGVMVPMSEMNEARRMACESLDAARLAAFAPARQTVHKYDEPLQPKAHKRTGISSVLTVHCDSLGKVNSALRAGAERILFGGDCFNHQLPSNEDYVKAAELCRKAGRQLAFATPRIVKEAQLGYFDKLFALWQQLEPDLVYINNNGLWPLGRKYAGLKLAADMSLNIFNSQALQFWQENGAAAAVLSPELTMAQVEHLAAVSPVPLECVIQGRLEMMVSEYCVGGSFLGRLHEGPCQFNCREQLYLGDRKEARFPVATDQFCRMHILNAHELSLLANVQHMAEIGVASLRIDGRDYDEARLGELVTLYRQVLGGAVAAPENLPGTTRGHYFRGVM